MGDDSSDLGPQQWVDGIRAKGDIVVAAQSDRTTESDISATCAIGRLNIIDGKAGGPGSSGQIRAAVILQVG